MTSRTRILVLEDNELAAKVLLHVLEIRGYQCLGVVSAEDAVACIPSFVPDVVVYEWALLGRTGLGLAHRMRALKPDLYIITLSAQDEPDGFSHVEQVDGYLTKPFSIAALEELLARRPIRG